MAPNLAPPQHDLIRDMILHQKLTTREMADAAGYSECSIKAIRSNLRYFGSTKGNPPKWWRRMMSVHHAADA
jgi:hypothetical protein